MPPPTVARRPPYKDFLQPALQRRFASTAGVVLAFSYVESVTLSRWDSLIWSWFPIGLPGLRALAIFACVLPLIVLRIAHSHMGIRTANSPFDILRRMIWQFQPVETILTYALSFWLFSQLYLLSIPEDANLGWITYYSGDRPRLNERALFYTVNLILIGVSQAFIHLVYDYDRLELKAVGPKGEGQAIAPREPDPWEGWRAQILRMLFRAGTTALAVSIANYVVVYSLLRTSAWGWAMTFFRLFYYNLPKTNIPPNQAPWSIWMLGRSIWAGFMCNILWEISDVTFTYQLQKGPLKNNLPLTTESKDPNGSLINGLKSKKPRIQAFAMLELAYIARDFEDRRKSIFEDIDRKDGPIWSQLFVICLNTIKLIEQRIDDYGKPPAPPPAAQAADAQPSQPPPRAAQPPKDEDVWLPAAPARGFRNSVGKAVGQIAKGKTPAETLGPAAKRGAIEIGNRVMTSEQKEILTPEGFNSAFRSLALQAIRLPVVGLFFQQTFRRRLNAAVLGTPYSEVSVYINAAFALSQLAVSSLTEDKYGNVQRDVPNLIRTFTTVIKKLERFRDELPSHWTDPEGDRSCHETDWLLDDLKVGLGRLIEAFGAYSADLRLSRADMRLAREAAVRRQTEEENGEAVDGEGGQRQPEMRQAN
ncbi:hypothetical protein DL765_008113 [Monosporascus sp. GIB2]|nr:hypothetical protein DL765_008113 [Monosporascus sp. GIB2]